MPLVAGVDSSTQSCKVVVRDAESGVLVREGRATHPEGTEVDPAAWWSALGTAVEAAGGLGYQRHGPQSPDHLFDSLSDSLYSSYKLSAEAPHP